MKTASTLLFLELVDHGSAKIEFARYGRTTADYTRRLNNAGRWAVDGRKHAPLIAWPQDSISEAEAAAERSSCARQRSVAVVHVESTHHRDFVLFEPSMESALLGYLPSGGQPSTRLQRDADKLAEFCAAVARVFFQSSDSLAQRQASREVAQALTAKYGGGSVTSAIQWLAGKTGEASLQAILHGEAELAGALSISEVAAICEYAKATRAEVGPAIFRDADHRDHS